MCPHDIASPLALKRGRHIAADTTGRCRVAPSPAPQRILEAETIDGLVSSGTLVVCADGGGVPVAADPGTGALPGADAVVDKDLTAALLVEDLKADFLLILTDVPCVYKRLQDSRTAARPPRHPRRAVRGDFSEDSMGPKAEAAARFVGRTGSLAAVAALDAAYEIVHGGSGTLVRPDPPAV